MLELSKAYTKALEEEKTMTAEQKALKNVGKQVRGITASTHERQGGAGRSSLLE